MYENLEFVICAAGECTRNFPHSKAIAHKSLLPMGDKRIIDYTLKDIVQMGAKHITIVCSNKKVINDFKKALAPARQIEEKLRIKGKTDIADILADTFLPDDIDLKFIIQKEPLGTAHVLYVARKAIQKRHVVLIFPDDLILSQDPQNPHIKRQIDAFLKDQKTILLTGLWREDVSNNAIIVNNRVVEKPKNATTHIGGVSPNILPNEVIQLLAIQGKDKIKQAKKMKKEWLYVDAINDFLNKDGEENGFKVEMFLKDDKDEMLDTGNLALYEQCQLEMLLKHSHYQKQNQAIAKKILSKLERD